MVADDAERQCARCAQRCLEVGHLQVERDAEHHEREDDSGVHTAGELEAVFDIPVKVSAVLGRARMEVNNLLKLGEGSIVELDRKVGEAIDIYVNDRLVARGEVVLVEDRLAVTMTEIIKDERA